MPLHRLRSRLVPIVVAAVVLAADVGATVWAQRGVPPRGIHVGGVLWLRLTTNSGVSFSLGSRWPDAATAAALAALVVVVLLMCFARPGAPAWGFGLMSGGGLGNLCERLFSVHRVVTDYVAVGSFAPFNLADAAITVGFLLVLGTALRGRSLMRAR